MYDISRVDSRAVAESTGADSRVGATKFKVRSFETIQKLKSDENTRKCFLDVIAQITEMSQFCYCAIG